MQKTAAQIGNETLHEMRKLALRSMDRPGRDLSDLEREVAEAYGKPRMLSLPSHPGPGQPSIPLHFGSEDVLAGGRARRGFSNFKDHISGPGESISLRSELADRALARGLMPVGTLPSENALYQHLSQIEARAPKSLAARLLSFARSVGR